MSRWGVIPSRWDRLSEYDRDWMMAFVAVESDVEAVGYKMAGKRPTFIVGLGVEDDG